MDACADRQRGIYIILNTRWGSGSQFLTVITEEELNQQMEIGKKNLSYFYTKKCQFFLKNCNLFIHQCQISAHGVLNPSKMLVQSELMVLCRSVEMGLLGYLVLCEG